MKSLRTLAAALAVAATLVPAFAFAQQYVQPYNQVGNLLVYVQVTNSNTNGFNRAPSDFAVTVNAQTASPSSFPGSLSGTSVLVGGNYSVSVIQQQGYTASYSSGCSGTMSNNFGQNTSATCIVTENNVTGYSNPPYSYYPNQYYSTYPYGNNGYSAPLTCSPSGQTVTIGQNVTFTAQGGDVSQYNWSNSSQPNNIAYNVGRSYTTTFLSPGNTTITVTNAQQSAICTVNVIGFPITGYNYNYPNNINPVNTLYPGSYPTVTVTPTYLPSLPNTGFAPIDASTLAIALALLFAASFATYPYVRKAFATVLG